MGPNNALHPIPTIRRATIGDVTTLLGLVEEYWRFESIPGFDPTRVGLQLQRLLSETHLGGVWIALSDDAPVGYMLAAYVFSLEHLGLTAEIDELFVRPQIRAIGIGGKLLQAAEAAFVAAGCTNVALQPQRLPIEYGSPNVDGVQPSGRSNGHVRRGRGAPMRSRSVRPETPIGVKVGVT